MTNKHNEKKILYTEQYLAWLLAGEPVGKEPFRDWEFRALSGDWKRFKHTAPVFAENIEYRYNPLPRTIKVTLASGEVLECPEPLRVMPKIDERYWVAALTGEPCAHKWDGCSIDKDWFNQGNCYATEADALARAEFNRKLHGSKA